MHAMTAVKLILPLAFFGYAGLANLSLVGAEIERPNFASFFDGEVTQTIDSIYRDNLPHREPAVGLIGAARYLVLNEGRSGVVSGKDGWLYSDEEFRPAQTAALSVEDALDWIEGVNEELHDLGVNLVVVPLPGKVDVAQTFSANTAKSLELERFFHDVVDELNARNIALVDAREPLIESRLAFFKTDTHWTPEGAKAVADHIAASGLVALGDQEFTLKPSENKEFFGDLVSFVTSENLAPRVGLHAETVEIYRAEPVEQVALGNLDLFGNSGPVPYALVGTSYSANENWSFAEALKASLKHDVLNFAEQGQGPIAPMRTFLSELNGMDIPETVIWEIPVRYLTDPDLMTQKAG